ncbi:M48 family metalloprotease [Streptacidiphilus fuscans]|uniref:Uncharacterized protein n=1 Tax=Streptacidiphilus fuscans TaxID=2789292 RepID=A0A931AZG1_9ACTN|nr:hypothetical protein [Streptacidiphilus fuscans]MBF9068365.1 hypothetical protein [Streptacidiphilus fuscans]
MGVSANGATARAAAILRLRGLAVALAAMPAALAAVLVAGRFTGHLGAPGSADVTAWDAARYAVVAVALLTLGWAAAFAVALRRARPHRTPSVRLTEREAPELHRLVRELAERMEVPAPGAIALTPDCDSWLEDETAPGGRSPAPPTLVVGSPFLWWMRVAELRALLAPVVAGAACALDPEIAAARRFTHGLDALLGAHHGRGGFWASIPARSLLRRSRVHAAEMERAVAGWASEQARQVDYGMRIAAQEQVGLAYAGWDRLLTRVALPAWRLGRCPTRLNAGVVSALTELSRRDRLAEGFESRLGERPACDLLEEPGRIDEATSLLAASLFYVGPNALPAPGSGESRLDWADYPREVVLRQWGNQSASLLAALGAEIASPAGALATALRALRAGTGEQLAAQLEAQRNGLPASRSGRDAVSDGLYALVCRAAVDAGRAVPGMDWLDGPVLLVDGRRCADLGAPIALAVEHGDDEPLRVWLEGAGISMDRPARLR